MERSASLPFGWLRSVWSFLVEVRQEGEKVTWPRRQEAVAGTIAVVVIVAIVASVLAIVDWILAYLTNWLLP